MVCGLDCVSIVDRNDEVVMKKGSNVAREEEGRVNGI